MTSAFQQAKITGLAAYLPAVHAKSLQRFQEVYDRNCHRVYALAFWMTDNEMVAEELMNNVFRRVFGSNLRSDEEGLDRLLLSELRELMPVGTLTLSAPLCQHVVGLRGTVKRTELERAVVQLPPTERLIFLMHDVEGYDHARITRTLGITRDDSQMGVHQARLRLRELLAAR